MNLVPYLDPRSPHLGVPTAYFAVSLVGALLAYLGESLGWPALTLLAFFVAAIGVVGVSFWVFLGWAGLARRLSIWLKRLKRQ